MGAALLSRAREQWERLAPTKRLALVIALAGVVGTLVVWLFLSTQVPYEVAFRDLGEEEASAVVEKLQELKIPYQLEGQGTIRVPSNLVTEAKVRVAGAGLLRGGGLGYELFNQPGFGLSDFIQQVNYQRALEGELARSIGQLDAVESARVHLALPRPSIFLNEQREPSAAVVLELKPGQRIDRGQAKAITNMVVGAVEGMKAEHVVLLDTRGQLLLSPESLTGNGAGAVNEQHEAQRAMEQDMEMRLQELLDRIVGTGRARAQVSLDLDWSRSEATSETFVPNGQEPQVRTSQELREVQTEAAAGGGVPGVQSNVPTYQQNQQPGQNTVNERTETNRTYELSRTVEKTQRAPGMVKRLSVAVAVDSSAIDPAEIENLTKVVQGAVGFDANRGDSLAVVPMSFRQTEAERLAQEASALRQQQQYWEIARLAALVLGPVLAILLLRLLLRRRRATLPTVRVEAMQQMSAPEAVATRLPDVPEAEPAILPQPTQDPRRAFIRSQLVNLANQDPALVASLLQTWLREDRRRRA